MKARRVQFAATVTVGGLEVEADVEAEVRPGYPARWSEYDGGYPAEPPSVLEMAVWVFGDDGAGPVDVVGKISETEFETLADMAIERAEEEATDGPTEPEDIPGSDR